MKRWDASLKLILICWWPFSLYSGWVTIAAMVNLAAYLVKIDWNPPFFSPEAWTLVMLLMTGVIHTAMIYLRYMREFAAVGVWALAGIYFRHLETYPVIFYESLIIGMVIFSNIIYHSWVNRNSNPFIRSFIRSGD